MAMSNAADTNPAHDDLAMLLPWYATGRLDDEAAAQVAEVLAHDPALIRQMELVREDYAASVLGNEAIRAPSARQADRLLAELDRREAPLASAMSALWQRITAALAMPSAGTVRWAAAAAAVVMMVQAGTIATLIVHPPASYAPASGKAATIEAGAVALVAFVADAPTAAVLELLAAHQMSIVHGPDAAGAVTVRLGSATMSETERQEKIAALKSRHDLVALVFTLR
jgi:hypothetical protein